MKKIITIICLAVVFTNSACENFLDEKPLSAISSQDFYITSEDAKAGVNAIYSVLASTYGSNGWYFGDVSTEIANRGELTGGLDVMDYTAADPVFRGFWSENYRGINYANLAISRIGDISMEEGLRNRYIAEAHFLRGLFYFDLVRAFGSVPLIVEPTVDDSNNRLPRTDTESVYDLIISDLSMAEATLPLTYSSSDIGRATKGAAQSLLAKVYLTKGDWQKARDKAQEVISSAKYSLFANMKDVFNVKNKNGKEHIFSVQFKSGNNRGGGSSFTSQFASRNPNILLNGAISGTSIATEPGFYDATPNHYRKRIMMVDSFPSKYYPEITAKGKAQAGPAPMKYWDATYGSAQGGDANWIILRYADILLIFAEAENELNGPSEPVYEKLNLIRKRARDENADGVNDATEVSELPDLANLTKEALREAIWKEREMELCFEGHHRWDLLRTGKFVEKLKASGRNADSKHVLFPIPLLEIQANPLLTQNEGYSQ